MARHRHVAIGIVLGVLLSASAGTVGADAEVEVRAGVEPRLDAQPPHPSIVILGDEGFLADDSGVVGGAGTEEDPYLIAGWNILHTRAAGIRLVDTRAHVVIQDVYMQGQEAENTRRTDCFVGPAWCDAAQGIGLYNAQNVTIRNVRIVGEAHGLRVISSAHVRVHDSVFGPIGSAMPFSPVSGIVIENSEDVGVVNATVGTATTTVRVFGSKGVIIADSTLVGSTTASSRSTVSFSDDVTFARNTVHRSLVNLGMLGEIAFLDNDFTGGDRAISWVDFSFREDHVHAVRLCGNRFSNYTGFAAVLLDGVGRLDAQGNTFADSATGIWAVARHALTFERNAVHRISGNGAVLDHAGAQVHFNSFEDVGGSITVPRAGSDATYNWWGDVTGPSGHGTGSGVRYSHSGSHTPYEPFLDARPSTAVGCGAPTLGAPEAHPPFVLEASVAIEGRVRVDPGAGREESRLAVARSLVAPIPLP